MNDAAPPRRSGCAPTITVISPGVNRAIRDLIERGRLNATSVMMVDQRSAATKSARCKPRLAKIRAARSACMRR